MALNEADIPTRRSQSMRGYQFRVRGPLGPTMLQAFPALTAERCDEDTLLRGAVSDLAALYGLLHRTEELGLELLELHVCEPRAGRRRGDQ
jgi:epsilon-lactone hydrolase